MTSMDVDVEIEDLAVPPDEAAAAARLRYIHDDEPGIQRKRWGRGFTYIGPDGEHISDDRQRRRFEELAIPPAWKEVWICGYKNGHIQATGRDDKGRKQYIYHPRWENVRNETKFRRRLPFGQALPVLRAQVDQDLRKHGLPRERVLAVLIRLIDRTLLRIGNEEYARKNDSYGLTTLQAEHLEVTATKLRFEFRGKGGKLQELDIRDRRAAHVVRRCQELPGQELFQYVNGDGRRHSVGSSEVNDYLRQVMGQSFTAKDFRTWGGTITAVRTLQQLGPAQSEGEAEDHIRQAIAAAAEQLGNTKAVCRQYYVHPAVLTTYNDGDFFAWTAVDDPSDDNWLEPDERATLALLQRHLSAS